MKMGNSFDYGKHCWMLLFAVSAQAPRSLAGGGIVVGHLD